jgi:hypothetical protein
MEWLSVSVGAVGTATCTVLSNTYFVTAAVTSCCCLCEILGSHSGVAEDLILLGCDMSLGD